MVGAGVDILPKELSFLLVTLHLLLGSLALTMSSHKSPHGAKMPETHRQTMEEATAEAEARPIDYDPTARAAYIRSMVTDIQAWIQQGDTEEVIKKRIPDFMERYPELFKKILLGHDLGPMIYMLSMLDRMGQGQLSQHQASIGVGQRLVQQYVTPKLEKSAKK